MADGIRVKIEDKGLRLRLDKFVRISEDLVAQALLVSAHEVRTTAVRSIQQLGKGAVYVRNGISHRASAPFDPPATDQGALVASIFAELRRKGKKPVAFVGSDIVYAKWLEFGTRRNLLPRPWLQPAWDQNEAKVTKRVGRAVREARKRSGR